MNMQDALSRLVAGDNLSRMFGTVFAIMARWPR